jgi:lipopolysaccharide transport system ATP-binding protein
MGDVAKAGRTVLFVSHNMPAVKHLCPRSIVLNAGAVAYDGPSAEAVKIYLSNTLGDTAVETQTWNGLRFDNPRPDPARPFEITRVDILDQEGDPKTALSTGDHTRFRIRWRSAEAVRNAGVELGIYTLEGAPLIQYSTRPVTTFDVDFRQGENEIDCEFPLFPLAAGQYYLSVGLTRPMLEWLYQDEQFALFTVEPGDVFASGTPIVSSRALLVVPHRWMSPNGKNH